MVLTLFGLYRQAANAVPIVKYALAVGGVVAVAAIVANLRVNLFFAIGAAVLMPVLMTILFLLGHARSASGNLSAPLRVFLWGSVLLVLASAGLLLSSGLFQWPLDPLRIGRKLTEPEQRIIELKYEVVAIRGDYEAIPTFGSALRSSVNERAYKHALELESIGDSDVDLARRILRDEYAAYAFTMAAFTSDSQKSRVDNSDQTIRLAKEVQKLADVARRDPAAQPTFDWITTDDTIPRVMYLSAIASCIKYRATQDQTFLEMSRTTLGSLPDHFLQLYPPYKSAEFAGCVTQPAGSKGGQG